MPYMVDQTVNGIKYDIKDKEARAQISTLESNVTAALAAKIDRYQVIDNVVHFYSGQTEIGDGISALRDTELETVVEGKIDGYTFENGTLHFYSGETEIGEGVSGFTDSALAQTVSSLQATVSGKIDRVALTNGVLHFYSGQTEIGTGISGLANSDLENVLGAKLTNYTFTNGVIHLFAGQAEVGTGIDLSALAGKIDGYNVDANGVLHFYSGQTEIGTGVSGLSNSELEEAVAGKIDGYEVDNNGVLHLYAGETEIGAGIQNIVNSNYVTMTALQNMLSGYVTGVTLNQNNNSLTVSYDDGSTRSIPLPESGISFDGGYVDEENKLHLTANGTDIANFDPITLPAGGGGGGQATGGSRLTFTIYTDTYFSVVESSGHANVEYKFSSIDNDTSSPTGAGTLVVNIGGSVRHTELVQQGDHLTIDLFPYLNKGTNTIRLIMTDSYGMTASRTVTIVLETFTVSWTLENVQINTADALNFSYTPYASGVKTIKIYVDDEEEPRFTDSVATTGQRIAKTITGLTHGSHNIRLTGEITVGSSILRCKELNAAVAQVDVTRSDPVIAVNWINDDLVLYDTVNMPFIVYDPQNSPATVTIFDGYTSHSESVERRTTPWIIRPSAVGEITLSIACRGQTASKLYQIVDSGITAQEVTDNLVCKVDPNMIYDLENWSYGNYGFTLSQGFDTVNGGIAIDENGVRCIKVMAGDRLTLNYDPFVTNPLNTGIELKMIFRVANVSNKRAVAISSMDNNRGFEIRANNAYIYGNQTSASLSICEDQRTELDIMIDKFESNSDKLITMMEKCSTFVFKQYTDDELFTHRSNVGITFGSDDAEVYIYLVRAYDSYLTTKELMLNYVFDGADSVEVYRRSTQNDIYDTSAGGSNKILFEKAANANPDCHFILINAEKMSVAKKKDGGSVTGTMRHVYVNGGNRHTFEADINFDVQGTSSVEHALTAGGNLNLQIQGKIRLDDGSQLDGYAMHGSDKSIAVDLFNYKKNVASQDHIVNRVCAEWYNRFQPSIRSARANDSRIRDCLESTMCAVFFHNTSNAPVTVGPDTVEPDETVFFGLGNLCSSKDCEETFAYDDIVIEVKQNFSDIARFKTDDWSGTVYDPTKAKNVPAFDYNYEFRYLNEEEYTEEEAKAEFQIVQTFICKTDYTTATGQQLATPETFNGTTYRYDTANYRKAKWIAEAPTIFDMDTLYWHHIVTLFFLLRDNRAKNMFWSKSNDSGKWGLWFNWDNDTGLCRNNEGYIDIEPGYMDWDTYTTGGGTTSEVFNASDNALFTSLRENNFAQLRAMYVDREAAGAWDIDDIYDYCKESQEQICESLWIEDAQHNAIRILENQHNSAYLERATGRLELHIMKALMFQKALVDSYFTASASSSDIARLRVSSPTTWVGVEPNASLSLTPYTDMYITVRAGNTSIQHRAYEGQPVSFTFEGQFNDAEAYVYSSQWISALSDLSSLYLKQFEIPNMKRVKEVAIGSDVAGFSNGQPIQLDFSNCTRLERLNLHGILGAVQALNLMNSPYLKYIDTRNSGITGLRFARNGRLQTALLNGIVSMYISQLKDLETFSMETYANLNVLTIENTPGVNALSVVNGATALEYVRLLGVDWELPNTRILKWLASLQGVDDSGVPNGNPIVGGIATIERMTMSDQTSLTAAFDNRLEIRPKYGNESYIPSYTVTFYDWDEQTVLATQSIGQGDSPDDSDITTPTRASTDEYDYTFDGWAMYPGEDADTVTLENINVLDDMPLYAHYTGVRRTYLVRWLNGIDELKRVYAQYGESVAYDGEIPTSPSEGVNSIYYLFKGWDNSTGFITGNLDVRATYDSATPPTSGTLADFSPEQLHALVASGRLAGNANRLISNGDTMNVTFGNDYDFLNVPSHVLVDLNDPKLLDGTTYYRPRVNNQNILLFDSDKSWTLAVDFALIDSQNANACMLACTNDFYGFELYYNSNYLYVRNGSKTYSSVLRAGVRNILVIRHKKGDSFLTLFMSNIGQSSVLGASSGRDLYVNRLEPSSVMAVMNHTAPLAFGAKISEDGYIDNYCRCNIHWAKLWDGFLADDICRSLAAYPKITYPVRAVGNAEHSFRNFLVAGGTSNYASLNFMLDACSHFYAAFNTSSMNSGGWKASELRAWLNSRMLAGFPLKWRAMMQKVIVNSSKGDMQYDLSQPPAEDYVWIPCLKDLNINLSTEPYASEAITTFATISTNAARARTNTSLLGETAGQSTGEYLTRSPNVNYNNYIFRISTSGDYYNYYTSSYSSKVIFGWCI